MRVFKDECLDEPVMDTTSSHQFSAEPSHYFRSEGQQGRFSGQKDPYTEIKHKSPDMNPILLAHED